MKLILFSSCSKKNSHYCICRREVNLPRVIKRARKYLVCKVGVTLERKSEREREREKEKGRGPNIALLVCISLLNSICSPSHHCDECGTRSLLRWLWEQGRCLDAPSIPEECLGPCQHSSKKKGPQAPGDKPTPSEEG